MLLRSFKYNHSIFLRAAFICILLVVFSPDSFSQTVRLVDLRIEADRSRNVEYVNNCLLNYYLGNDTLIVEIVSQLSPGNKPSTYESISFRADTVFLNYESPVTAYDTLMVFDSVKNRYHTILIIQDQNIYFPDDYLSRLTFRVEGITKKPEAISFNDIILKTCTDLPFKYDVVKGDTINMINAYGWKHGIWIKKISSEPENCSEIKYYDNGEFLEGYIITESGDTTHTLHEGALEMAIPYKGLF